MPQDVAYIANITEQSWIAQRTYGTFQVRGCVTRNAGGPPAFLRADDEDQDRRRAAGGAENGADYALTPITARKGTIDLGDKRVLDFPISAREIAEDVAREINSDAGDASYFGAFVCAGDAPTAEELTAARARLTEYYRKLVAQADQDWERAHNWLMITDVERRAARWLGLEKEWSYEPRPLVECPACAEKLKPGVAVCKSCGAVLDAEKAARFGFAPAASAARSPAAPPTSAASAPVEALLAPPVAEGHAACSAPILGAGTRAGDEDQGRPDESGRYARQRAAGATEGTLPLPPSAGSGQVQRAATQTQSPQTRPREGKRS